MKLRIERIFNEIYSGDDSDTFWKNNKNKIIEFVSNTCPVPQQILISGPDAVNNFINNTIQDLSDEQLKKIIQQSILTNCNS